MVIDELKAKGEDLVAKIEAGEGDVEQLQSELDSVMKKIDVMGKAKEAKSRLGRVQVDVPENTQLPVVEDKTSLAKAEVVAFHKAWTGARMGDTEAGLVYNANGALRAPTALKVALFGKNVARQMGWAKKINPADDSALIPNQYDSQLSYIPGEASGLTDLVRVVPCPRGNLQVTRLDRSNSPSEWGVAGGWLVSGSTKPESEPVWERKSINCGEVAVYSQVADRTFTRSAFDLMGELMRMFRGDLKYLIDIAIMQGSGTNQPTGIIGYAGVALETRETINTVEYKDLNQLIWSVNPRVKDRGVFVIQHDAMREIGGTLATVDGRPLFAPTTAAGPYDRLLGYPYIVTVDCNAALGSDGDVVFGDFSHYTLAMEDDVVFASDDGKGTGFTSNSTYVKAYASVGGLPIEPDAFAVLDGTVTT